MSDSKCPRCNKDNKCGLAAGKSKCWCFYKERLECDKDEDSACYCEQCYDKLLKLQELSKITFPITKIVGSGVSD